MTNSASCDDDVQIVSGEGQGKTGVVIGIGGESYTEVLIDGEWRRLPKDNIRRINTPTKVSVLVDGTVYKADEVKLVRKFDE